jgi:predicted extracellular nuclease
MERFFDDVDDPGIGEPVLTTTAYANRLKKASLQIRDYLKTPDIIGVIEIEKLDALFDLVGQITADAIADGDPDPDYLPYLSEGNDVGGIDVGFLVKKQLVDGKVSRVQVISVTQENADELFVNPDTSTELLNDRPPLVLRAFIHHESGESFPVSVIVNHLRSLNGANAETPGSNGWSTDGARVRAKRQKQAESLANLIQARQVDNPEETLVVLGDFNFFEVNDGLTHGMGVVTGAPVPDNETAVPGDGIDLVDPNLTRLEDASATERYSFIFDGNAQSLDHLLINAPLEASTTARRIEHPRINADYPAIDRSDYTAGNPRRLADHDPLVAFFTVEAFATTIFVDGFESESTVRWSSTQP